MKRLLTWCGVGAGVCLITAALLPWHITNRARPQAIEGQVERLTGLKAVIGGTVAVKFLPRPRLRATDVSIASSDGAVSIVAPVIYADLDIPALIRGRTRLVSATLANPSVTIDVDRAEIPATLVGRDAEDDEAALPLRASLRSAVVRLVSARPWLDTLLTDVNLTAHRGAGSNGEVALSGSLVWRGLPEQFTLAMENAGNVARQGSSPAHLQVTSPLGTLTAVGDIVGGPQPQFAGRLSATTSSVPALLDTCGCGRAVAGLRRASLGGDAMLRWGDLSLSGATVRLNDSVLEGTLGFHADGARTLLEGTLATDRLDVDSLAGGTLDRTMLNDAARALTETPTTTSVDLRVSAGAVVVGGIELQDTAFSAMARDARLELTVDEAHAFQGTVKARTVATVGRDGVDAHGELSVVGADAGALASALSGRETVTGTLSGKVSVDGRSPTSAGVIQALGGEGQATIEHGSFVGVSVAQALKRMTRKIPPTGGQRGQVTSFSSVSTKIGITGGVVHLLDGKVIGPGIALDFGGQTDLPRGQVDIEAVASQTDVTGSILPDAPRLPFALRGTWGEPFDFVARGHGLTLPVFPLPANDGPAGPR